MIAKKDPLQKLIGLCDEPEGPLDASIHHDKYLYGKLVLTMVPVFVDTGSWIAMAVVRDRFHKQAA